MRVCVRVLVLMCVGSVLEGREGWREMGRGSRMDKKGMHECEMDKEEGKMIFSLCILSIHLSLFLYTCYLSLLLVAVIN